MTGKSQLLLLTLFGFEVFLSEAFGGGDDFAVGIVGGKGAVTNEFPFMAALGWQEDNGEIAYMAGGMVISPRMVLTAAHCVYRDGKLPDLVFIGGGVLQVRSTDLHYLTHFFVANVTIFPRYDPNQGYDDIAILELEGATKFKHVCLWSSPIIPNIHAIAIGYGLTEFAGEGSKELLAVNLTIFQPALCRPFFEHQRKLKLGLSSAQICAGDMEEKQDTCQGDSGGPLLIKQDDRMFAVGITSSGLACSGFPPSIYTRIYPYLGWIASVLEEQGESFDVCIN